VHRLRDLTQDSSDEMLQYQQTLAAQKCYFDPFKPGTSEESPKKEHLTMAAEFQTKLLTPNDFIKNTKILLKAQEELQFCDEQGHTP